MAIRMIVTDLDGTLLNSRFRIPAENKAALQAAAAKGVFVTLATGRMYSSARPYALELGIDAPIITYNGAVVKSVQGEVLFSSYLATDTVAAVLRYCFARQWYVQLYAGGELYYAVSTAPARAYEKAAGVKGTAVGEAGLLARTQEVPKLLVVVKDPSETDAAVKALSQAFTGQITAMKSNPTYIEVIHPGVSKGAALLALAAQRGIRAEEIMALGDSNNDLSMLRAAGLGVAMGNAMADVKAAADVVTADCEAGGLAAAVRQYVL